MYSGKRFSILEGLYSWFPQKDPSVLSYIRWGNVSEILAKIGWGGVQKERSLNFASKYYCKDCKAIFYCNQFVDPIFLVQKIGETKLTGSSINCLKVVPPQQLTCKVKFWNYLEFLRDCSLCFNLFIIKIGYY